MNKPRDVNSGKRRESRHFSNILESSRIMSPPENEIVAVFSCKSDDSIRFDQAESSEASFHTRDEVSVIARSHAAAPWFGRGWKLLATRLVSP